MIELPADCRDLLVELADAGAEFVVLGGHEVAFHGHPRATKDLDVLVRADRTNATRVYKALRIDILNRASGITFDEAVADGDAFEIDNRRIPVIGRAALIRNKRASGREQDLADVVALERLAPGR